MVRMKSSITFFIFMVVLTVLSLVGCSPRVVSSEDIQTATVPPFIWSPKMDCAFCHTSEAASFNEEMAASFHSDQDCVACHDDPDVIAEAHAEISMNDTLPTKLSLAAIIPDDLCESCHSLEDLSQATVSSTILTDENGTTVNPHNLPEAHQGQKVSCNDCHVMHKTYDITSSAPNTCITCHHENVYECGTCHE